METYYENNKLQLFLGLLIGIVFGFLLQKGGVTKYDVILAQLRLMDFTVLKVMLSAVIVTMLGISYLYPKGKVQLHPKSGSIKNAVIGGLIFGVGFAILGYCPGTIAGAVGNGYVDGLIGGMTGIIIGSGIFASMYNWLKRRKLIEDDHFSEVSLFQRMNGNPFKYTLPFALLLIGIMAILEVVGL